MIKRTTKPSFSWKLSQLLPLFLILWSFPGQVKAGTGTQGFSRLNVPLQLVSPSPGATHKAGERVLIKWRTGNTHKKINRVRLEYSADNGTTYSTITGNIPNTGQYPWLVPHHISPRCRIRVTDTHGNPRSNYCFYYSFDFDLPFPPGSNENADSPGLVLYLGDAANPAVLPYTPKITIHRENNGQYTIGFLKKHYAVGALSHGTNRLDVSYDPQALTASLSLNEKTIAGNLSLPSDTRFSAAVSIVHNEPPVFPLKTTRVSVRETSAPGLPLLTLFKQNHTGSPIKETADWVSYAPKNPLNRTGQPVIVKNFSIPLQYPFHVVDTRFDIGYNKTMNSGTAQFNQKHLEPSSAHGPSGNPPSSPKPGFYHNRTRSTVSAGTARDTYYIYSYDGKLMAEYDHEGACVKNYIYVGNRLLAEHTPQTGKYFYYMNDQHNTTRLITDDTGTVVHSAAYGPYGEIQKTWVNTYEPKLKFSGKEREAYSDLDYFGARYYGHSEYRFISADPVINKKKALYNPQYWNLYSYCINNPVTFLDPDGRDILEDLFGKAKEIVDKGTSGVSQMIPQTMMMDGWEEQKKTNDKHVKNALKIAVAVSGALVALDIVVGNEKGGGEKKPYAKHSGKNDRHGDSGRAVSKTEKQIQELKEKLKTATGTEKTKLEFKIQKIEKIAKKKKRGTVHNRTEKGNRR